MKLFRSYCVLFAMSTCALASSGQSITQIKLMSHNMLNFPTGNIQGRVDTLQKIVNYVQPDLLMIQELKTAQGLADINTMMNTLGYGNFASCQFIAQQSDAGNPYPLQHAIVFNEDKLKLKSQFEVTTEVRDVNEYVMYINDPGLATGSDTTFIYVYVTHLKSSEGADNEALRLSMVNDWLAHMAQNFTGDENVIIAGDFNIYTNQEEAYIALTSADNTVTMHDVFSEYGNWNSTSFTHKEILTQSTRSSQVAGDGAGGGVDDRFDFILFSEALMDLTNPVFVEPDSYLSLGNTGNCYNQNITDCDAANDVSYDVLRAIYYMSDHIPQVCNLGVQLDLGTEAISPTAFNMEVIRRFDNALIQVESHMPCTALIALSDATGRLIQCQNITLHSGLNQFTFPLNALNDGLYLFSLAADPQILLSSKLSWIR
ncbi:MAG: endonuclease/exonuclease/phosphatase family protein [Flavobacteriales bacterium]